MNRSRKALEADVKAFLASGGVIQNLDCARIEKRPQPSTMSRREAIAYRKRLDGAAIERARSRKAGERR